MTSKSPQSSEPTQFYNNVKLYWDEVIALQDLEALIGEPVQCANGNEGINPDSRFIHDNFHVIGISFCGKNISDLPLSFSNLTQLKIIELSQSKVTTFPLALKGLKFIISLDLSFNRITELPDWIGDLTSLTGLSLNSNKIKFLPESMWNLTKITHLDIGKNKLTDISKSIKSLVLLSQLYLEYNQLHTLPFSFKQFKNLKELDLSFNSMESIPEGIASLQITSLNLKYNRLKNIPEKIFGIKTLESLYLVNNPLNVKSLLRIDSIEISEIIDYLTYDFPETIPIKDAVILADRYIAKRNSMSEKFHDLLAKNVNLSLRDYILSKLPASDPLINMMEQNFQLAGLLL